MEGNPGGRGICSPWAASRGCAGGDYHDKFLSGWCRKPVWKRIQSGYQRKRLVRRKRGQSQLFRRCRVSEPLCRRTGGHGYVLAGKIGSHAAGERAGAYAGVFGQPDEASSGNGAKDDGFRCSVSRDEIDCLQCGSEKDGDRLECSDGFGRMGGFGRESGFRHRRFGQKNNGFAGRKGRNIGHGF